MAKYDRSILVPYLNDVCSTEMLCVNLGRQIEQCKTYISDYKQALSRKIVVPVKPILEDYIKEEGRGKEQFTECLLTICGLLLICFGVILIFLAWILAIPVIWFGKELFLEGSSYRERKEQGRRAAEKAYQGQMDNYTRQVKRNAQILDSRPRNEAALKAEQERLAYLKNQLNSAKVRLQELYDVNIIPSRYRNIYASYYLFDYFYASREDDLDRIIQTLLLDEIVQHLKKVIQQNEEKILLERMQLALEQENNHILAASRREQMEHLVQIETNQERQFDYQNMIVQHQMTTNLFLAADYLHKRQ